MRKKDQIILEKIYLTICESETQNNNLPENPIPPDQMEPNKFYDVWVNWNNKGWKNEGPHKCIDIQKGSEGYNSYSSYMSEEMGAIFKMDAPRASWPGSSSDFYINKQGITNYGGQRKTLIFGPVEYGEEEYRKNKLKGEMGRDEYVKRTGETWE